MQTLFQRELSSLAQQTRRRLRVRRANGKGHAVPTIYFSHGLTGVDPNDPHLIEAKDIKDRVSAFRVRILDFFGLGPCDDPEEIVRDDMRKALKADLLVFLHIGPSYGTGAEVHVRAQLGLPVLILCRAGTSGKISRMITGATAYGDHVRIEEYWNGPGDAAILVRTALNRI